MMDALPDVHELLIHALDKGVELREKLKESWETNARLNRRCQELEGIIAKKGEACYWARERYNDGYQAARNAYTETSEVKRWNLIASQHGIKNAKLRREIQRALDIATYSTGRIMGFNDLLHAYNEMISILQVALGIKQYSLPYGKPKFKE